MCVCVSQCLVWTVAGMCHCNSHNRSVFWRSSRDTQLLGFLQRFCLTLLEVDPELRLAGTHTHPAGGGPRATASRYTHTYMNTHTCTHTCLYMCVFRGIAAEVGGGASSGVRLLPEGNDAMDMLLPLPHSQSGACGILQLPIKSPGGADARVSHTILIIFMCT